LPVRSRICRALELGSAVSMTQRRARLVPGTDGGPPINVLVDYLMAREMDTIKNSPALVGGFAA
jgi:hypothetical protein